MLTSGSMTTTATIAAGEAMRVSSSSSPDLPDAGDTTKFLRPRNAALRSKARGGSRSAARMANTKTNRKPRSARALCARAVAAPLGGARPLGERAGGRHRPAREGYPAVIWLLLGGNLVVRAAGFAYPFMAFHVAGRGFAAAAVGAVLAAFGVGWAVGQLVCGWLVDSLGPRATLAWTMTIAAGVLVGMAEARSVAALLVGAMITGVVYDAPRPVMGAAIAELIPEPSRRAKLDACVLAGSSASAERSPAVWADCSPPGPACRCCSGSTPWRARCLRWWRPAASRQRRIGRRWHRLCMSGPHTTATAGHFRMVGWCCCSRPALRR